MASRISTADTSVGPLGGSAVLRSYLPVGSSRPAGVCSHSEGRWTWEPALLLHKWASNSAVSGPVPLAKASHVTGSGAKESVHNAEDSGSIPGSGRSPGEGNDYPLQYSCLENPMDREAWQATVHEITKSWTRLSD